MISGFCGLLLVSALAARIACRSVVTPVGGLRSASELTVKVDRTNRSSRHSRRGRLGRVGRSARPARACQRPAGKKRRRMSAGHG